MFLGFPYSMILGFFNFKREPEKFYRRKYHLIPHPGDGIPWCQNLSSSYAPNELIFPPNFEVSLFLPLCFSPRKKISYFETNFAEKSSKLFKFTVPSIVLCSDNQLLLWRQKNAPLEPGLKAEVFSFFSLSFVKSQDH